jgi:transcription elongation factor Elf1
MIKIADIKAEFGNREQIKLIRQFEPVMQGKEPVESSNWGYSLTLLQRKNHAIVSVKKSFNCIRCNKELSVEAEVKVYDDQCDVDDISELRDNICYEDEDRDNYKGVKQKHCGLTYIYNNEKDEIDIKQ